MKDDENILFLCHNFSILEHTVEMERGGFHYHQTIFGK